MPDAIVALPCASRSTSRMRRFVSASAAARLTAVVVLPTPPFWFAMAMMRVMNVAADPREIRRARAGGGILAAIPRLVPDGAPFQNHEVPLGIEPGHVQLDGPLDLERIGHLRELVVRKAALERE